jgi:uncharacterized protein YbgA (DUF1722 family)/uncharacterized protein YbbK (DUF523 family)
MNQQEGARTMPAKIKVGISTCLLGEPVRYDGGHKLDRFIRDTLGLFFDFLPVCPEEEVGLGTPREAMRLVGDIDRPRLVTNKTGIDHTERMLEFSRRRAGELESEELCGFIFKSKSPSSGMERVKVYNNRGMPVKKGVGLWARTFMEHFPNLPVEEEGRLHDLPLRENFIQRVFIHRDWRDLLDQGRSSGRLVEFHTRIKLLVRAHSYRHYRLMGNVVARAGSEDLETLYSEYEDLLTQAFRLKTTIKKNTDCLQHCLGFFKKVLSPAEKQEMLKIIQNYREGNIPLIVPITMINYFVRKYDQPYLDRQRYLNPLPLELKLRNHA